MHLVKVATDCAALFVRAALFGGALLLTAQTAAAPTLESAESLRANAFGGAR